MIETNHPKAIRIGRSIVSLITNVKDLALSRRSIAVTTNFPKLSEKNKIVQNRLFNGAGHLLVCAIFRKSCGDWSKLAKESLPPSVGRITTAICPSRFALQISHRYLHLLFNSPKNLGPASFISFSVARTSLILRAAVAFLFPRLFPAFAARCHPRGVTDPTVAVPPVSLPTLGTSPNATGTFRRSPRCVQIRRQTYEWRNGMKLFVKADDLFSDSALWHACARAPRVHARCIITLGVTSPPPLFARRVENCVVASLYPSYKKYPLVAL